MRKFVIVAIMLFALIALAACDGNSETQEPQTAQNENTQTDVDVTEMPTEGDYSIIINGVGFDGEVYYTITGQQHPTHVIMACFWCRQGFHWSLLARIAG